MILSAIMIGVVWLVYFYWVRYVYNRGYYITLKKLRTLFYLFLAHSVILFFFLCHRTLIANFIFGEGSIYANSTICKIKGASFTILSAIEKYLVTHFSYQKILFYRFCTNEAQAYSKHYQIVRFAIIVWLILIILWTPVIVFMNSGRDTRSGYKVCLKHNAILVFYWLTIYAFFIFIQVFIFFIIWTLRNAKSCIPQLRDQIRMNMFFIPPIFASTVILVSLEFWRFAAPSLIYFLSFVPLCADVLINNVLMFFCIYYNDAWKSVGVESIPTEEDWAWVQLAHTHPIKIRSRVIHECNLQEHIVPDSEMIRAVRRYEQGLSCSVPTIGWFCCASKDDLVVQLERQDIEVILHE